MAFKALIEILNTIINILNQYKLRVYDFENHNWYLKEIYYDTSKDKIFFKCEEEK